MDRPLKIGVLSLQGSVEEHLASLRRLPQVKACPVKTLSALQEVDGLILPGGESTTIGKLLRLFSLQEPLKKRIMEGMPVWGTCCGMILLAQHLVGEEAHLGLMDITVRRNAYGRQIDSFHCKAFMQGVGEIPLVFIRAPWIEAAGPEVQPLLTLRGHMVAARQNHMLVTSFHPELTEDLSVHRYFVAMVREAVESVEKEKR